MNLLDMRTVILSYTISNLICLVVIAILWKRNRRRFPGLGFWLADFLLQFFSLGLVALRGVIPDFLSMTVSNTLVIGGTLSLYIGLEHFTGTRGRQIHNYILLLIFAVVHAYFVFVFPSLVARNLLISLGLLIICFQCAWLMLLRVAPEMRLSTRGVGYVFLAFCLVSLGRVAVTWFAPPESDFFQSNAYDTLLLVTYQMLFIVLTFSLFLLVNNRLFTSLRDSEERYQTFLSQSFEAIYRTEFDHPIDISLPVETQIDQIYENAYMAECNQALADMYNLPSVDAMIGKRLLDAHGGSNNPVNRAAFRKLIEGGYKSTNDETIEQDGLGNPVWFLNNTIGIIENGFLIRLWGTAIDVTERKRAEETQLQISRRNQIILETAGEGIYGADKDGKITFINPSAVRMLGWSAEELIGQSNHEMMHHSRPDGSSYPPEECPIRSTIQDGCIHQGEEVFWRKDGASFPVGFTSNPVMEDGHTTGVVVTFRDISERRHTEGLIQLRLRLWEFSTSLTVEGLMQKALDEIGAMTGSPIGFYHFVEGDQNMLSLQAWSTRTRAEFCKAEGAGMHYPISEAGVWVDCVREKRPVIHNDYASLPHRKGMPKGHAAVVRELVVPTMRGGQVVSILGVGNKSSDYNEQDVNLVSYIADVIWTIVEYKQAEEHIHQLNNRLERLAMTDELTGLANRRSFFLRGGEEIQRVQRYPTPLSLIMLDIDRFKNINDTYGHAAGDRVLQYIANALRVHIRDTDVVARLGGEEFGVLLLCTQSAEAVKLAERLRQAIEIESCGFEGQTIHVTISIGVAEYRADMLNLDTVLRNADAAMYQAKSQGRNRVVCLD